MPIKKFTAASILAGILSPSAFAAVDAEALTYNRDIFKQSPQEIASKFPEFKWDGNKSNPDSLELWGQPIESVTLKAAKRNTDSIEFLLNSSKPAQKAKLSAWTKHLESLTGKTARRLPTRAIDGDTLTQSVWETSDSVLLLTSRTSESTGKLTLRLMSKPLGAGLLGGRQSSITSRSFYNSDYSSAIEGTLLDYNPDSGVVKITSRNSTKNLQFDQLSKTDQRYVESNRALVAALRGLELKFTEVKAEPEKKGRRSTVNTKFTIEAYNRSDASIEGLTLKYTILHRKGGVSTEGTDLQKTTGEIEFSSLFGKYYETSDTKPIPIVKETKPASGGG